MPFDLLPAETKPNRLADKLCEVRAKIADRKNWTRGCYARDEKNRNVDPFHNNAVKWCLAGAVHAVLRTAGEINVCCDALEKAAGCQVPVFNDYHIHADVLQVIDRAIAFARMANH
jgi:hypothetical protein